MPVTVTIGGIAVALSIDDVAFRARATERYQGFVTPEAHDALLLTIELAPPGLDPDADVDVTLTGDRLRATRGDFAADVDLRTMTGHVRQSTSLYALDSVLRVVHSVMSVRRGGMLVHAASVVRGGRAYVFAGVSGAGKTTLVKNALPDVTLLSDEISYLGRDGARVLAFGTPFFGDLGRSGAACSAPLAGLFSLEKGARASLRPLTREHAGAHLLRNMLFFVRDDALTSQAFFSACAIAEETPAFCLTFPPDETAWTAIP